VPGGAYPKTTPPLPREDQSPHLICGLLVPLESLSQTTSWSVQPLLHSSHLWRTHTNTQCYICSNWPHVCIPQTVYRYFWAYLFFYFLVFFLFFRFLVVGFLQQTKLTHVSFWLHIKTASRIVSCRMHAMQPQNWTKPADHHHHHFICPIIQQYAHFREYDSRRAGQQSPIRTLTAALKTFNKKQSLGVYSINNNNNNNNDRLTAFDPGQPG